MVEGQVKQSDKLGPEHVRQLKWQFLQVIESLKEFSGQFWMHF
jgi:hypothetical protein